MHYILISCATRRSPSDSSAVAPVENVGFRVMNDSVVGYPRLPHMQREQPSFALSLSSLALGS